MHLIVRHNLLQVCIVTVGIDFAMVHSVILVPLRSILGPIVRGTVPWSVLLDAYLGALPNAVYLCLPLAAALAATFMLARSWGNGTLAVMYGSRLSPWAVACPSLLCAGFSAVVGALIANLWAPEAASTLEDTKHRVLHTAEASGIEAGRFNVVGPQGDVLFVRHWAEKDRAVGVFIFQKTGDASQRSILAKEALFVRQSSLSYMILLHGTLNNFEGGQAATKPMQFERLVVELSRPEVPPRLGRPPYEVSTADLLNLSSNQKADDRFVRHARSEIHKRIAIPLLVVSLVGIAAGCCLVFGGPGYRGPRFALIGGGVLALYIGFIVLLDTGLRYSPLLVPLVYVAIGAAFGSGMVLIARVAGWQPLWLQSICGRIVQTLWRRKLRSGV